MRKKMRGRIIYTMITAMLCLQLAYAAIRTESVNHVQAAAGETEPADAQQSNNSYNEGILPVISLQFPQVGTLYDTDIQGEDTAETTAPVEETAELGPETPVQENAVYFAASINLEALEAQAAQNIPEETEAAVPQVTAADLRAEQLAEKLKTEEDAASESEEEARNLALIGKIAVADVTLALNVRQEPTEESELLGRLYRGTGAKILEIQDEWARVSSGVLSGWVLKEHLVTDEAASALMESINPQVATVVATELCVRAGADDEANILTTVGSGAQFPVLEISGSWVKIQLTTRVEGYVHAEYVSVEKGLFVGVLLADEAELQQEVNEREASREAIAQEAKRAASSKSSSSSSKSSSSSSSSGSSSSGSSSSGSSSSGKSSTSSENSEANESVSTQSSSSDDGWVSMGTFKITAYCACSKCNGGNAGKTSSGATPSVGYTLAADTSVLPIGTKVKIEGKDSIYCVEDTGVRGKTIDLFVSSHSGAYEWGVRYREIWVQK